MAEPAATLATVAAGRTAAIAQLHETRHRHRTARVALMIGAGHAAAIGALVLARPHVRGRSVAQ